MSNNHEEDIQKAIDEADVTLLQTEPNLWFSEMRPELGKEMVNDPDHYDFFDMTAIQAIERVLNHDEYMGFLKGNALKYRLRAGKKDNLKQDIAKAEWYEAAYERYVEENTPNKMFEI